MKCHDICINCKHRIKWIEQLNWAGDCKYHKCAWRIWGSMGENSFKTPILECEKFKARTKNRRID